VPAKLFAWGVTSFVRYGLAYRIGVATETTAMGESGAGAGSCQNRA
jgi:hypothetical protein